jgi:hypothetical protein
LLLFAIAVAVTLSIVALTFSRPSRGLRGPPGLNGIVGGLGPTGTQGPTGDTGQTGPQGGQGESSNVTGPQGPTGLRGATGPTGSFGALSVLYRYGSNSQQIEEGTATGIIFLPNANPDVNKNIGGWTTPNNASFYPALTGLFQCAYTVPVLTSETGLRFAVVSATNEVFDDPFSYTDITQAYVQNTMATGSNGFAVTVSGTFITTLSSNNPVTVILDANGGTWTVSNPSLSCTQIPQ